MRFFGKRKGISPLVAAVLLIAFTMAVAAILTAWITSFTSKQQEKSEVFETKIACSYQNIQAKAEFSRYNSTENIFETYISNSGTEDTIVTQVVLSKDGVNFDGPPRDLNPTIAISKGGGTSFKLNLTNVLNPGDSFQKIRFYTSCGPDYFTTLSMPVGGWASLADTSGANIMVS